MSDTNKKVEKFLKKIERFMNELPEDDKTWFASCAVHEITFNATNNHLEAIGFLQLALVDYHENFKAYTEEEQKEKE